MPSARCHLWPLLSSGRIEAVVSVELTKSSFAKSNWHPMRDDYILPSKGGKSKNTQTRDTGEQKGYKKRAFLVKRANGLTGAKSRDV